MKKVLYFLFACVLVLFSTINVYGDSRYLLTVTVQGEGQIKVDYPDEDLYYSKNHPVQKATKRAVSGTKFKAGAKASEGYVFKKWVLDGEDYSTDKETEITVIRNNMNLVAVFEEGTEEAPVDNPVKSDSNENNVLLYIGLGTIVVLLIAIGVVLSKRKK